MALPTGVPPNLGDTSQHLRGLSLLWTCFGSAIVHFVNIRGSSVVSVDTAMVKTSGLRSAGANAEACHGMAHMPEPESSAS
jgi:hypothetical protein